MRLLTALVAVLLLAGTETTANAAPGPFSGMEGTWSGNGSLIMTSGTRERLRCRATYDVAAEGNSLRLELRCASDSYNFELAGDVQARDGVISGLWTEASRKAAGTISGRAGPDRIDVVATGAGFSANLALSTRGKRQSVTIEPRGTEVNAVTVTLSKP